MFSVAFSDFVETDASKNESNARSTNKNGQGPTMYVEIECSGRKHKYHSKSKTEIRIDARSASSLVTCACDKIFQLLARGGTSLRANKPPAL